MIPSEEPGPQGRAGGEVEQQHQNHGEHVRSEGARHVEARVSTRKCGIQVMNAKYWPDQSPKINAAMERVARSPRDGADPRAAGGAGASATPGTRRRRAARTRSTTHPAAPTHHSSAQPPVARARGGERGSAQLPHRDPHRGQTDDQGHLPGGRVGVGDDRTADPEHREGDSLEAPPEQHQPALGGASRGRRLPASMTPSATPAGAAAPRRSTTRPA